MNHALRIELLGGLRAHSGERVIERFRTQKEGALFAYLAYHLQRPHLREQLTEMLWPDAEPEAGRNRLKQTLSTLRRQLEPPGVSDNSILTADRVQVRLNPAAFSTDAHDFETALRTAARTDSPDKRSEEWLRAVELYGGELLPGYYEDWILTERQRLSDAFVGAVRQVIPILEAWGDFESALNYAHRAVAADPYLEEAHGDLMRLYARLNRPTEALRHYREVERILDEGIAAKPGAELRALQAQIARGDFGGSVSFAKRPAPSEPESKPVQAEKSVPEARHESENPKTKIQNSEALPLRFDRYFGREPEIARLRELLVPASGAASRLITITGPGGMGKSRFVTEVVRQLSETDSGMAVCFVALADIADPCQLTDAVAHALDLPDGAAADPMEPIVAHLRSRPSLLILDNMEQLLTADNPQFKLRNPKSPDGAAFVWRLLSLVPNLTVLVTSRQALELTGEREFPLAPLAVPDTTENLPEALLRYPGVALFVDRAQATTPDFQLTARNAESIALLCVKLEGIPLAIELAAARVRVFSPAQMVNQLGRRFDFLVSRQRNVEERHRTLWAAVEWSFYHLPPELRDFFVRLAVFRGGWSLEAAQAVCGAEETDGANGEDDAFYFAGECLSQLRIHSLIVAEENESGYRFRMLETLREFAQTHLVPDAERDAKRRHARYFARTVTEIAPHLSGGEQAVWLRHLDSEQENVRAALDWCAEPDNEGETGLKIVAGFWRYWQARAYLREGRALMERALHHPDAQEASLLRANALNGAGNLAIHQSDYAAALPYHEAALELRRALADEPGIASSLNNLGIIAQNRGDYAQGRTLFEEALARYGTLANRVGQGYALSNLGIIAQKSGDYALSLTRFREALALNRELKNRSGEALNLGNIGVTAYLQGDKETAKDYSLQALALSRELGDRGWEANMRNSLGNIFCDEGDYATAHTYYRECLVMRHEMGHKRGVLWALEGFGYVAAATAQYALAVQYFSAADLLREQINAPRLAANEAEYEQTIALLREKLGPKDFLHYRNAAREMPLDKVVELALRSE